MKNTTVLFGTLALLGALLGVGALPGVIRALSWERIERGTNVIEVQGACAQAVTVLLVNAEGEQVYSGGATCITGQFRYRDGLTHWRIPSGNYRLGVAEGTQAPDFTGPEILIQASGDPAPPTMDTTAEQIGPAPDEQFANSTASFFGALQMLAESLEKLESTLPSASFSQPVRDTLQTMLAMFTQSLRGMQEIFGGFIEQVTQPETVLPTPGPPSVP